MGLFPKDEDQEAQPVSQRQQLESRYASARHNILLVLVFTVVNIVLLLLNQFTYFVFSASIPYAIVVMGMTLCGKMPEELYPGGLSQYEFIDSSVLTVAVGIAAAICGLYLLCWLLSKKGKVAWLIVALVLFVVDTVIMFVNGIDADSILDVVFHAWVIISFSMGIAAHYKLKKLSTEEPTSPELP